MDVLGCVFGSGVWEGHLAVHCSDAGIRWTAAPVLLAQLACVVALQ